ncbi:MAG: RNA ligase 1 family protein [Promethearchaeota archaeon]
MKKIPTVFIIKWDNHRRIVTEQVYPPSQWIIDGEGVATRKYDGSACKVDSNGKLWKRFDRKKYKKGKFKGQFKPKKEEWIPCQEPDEKTGHWPGWLPVDFSFPDDKWHKDAWEQLEEPLEPGTYELCGPKINGNPEKRDKHIFIRHGNEILDVKRTYNDIRNFLKNNYIEGIVFHHSDGRMAKIKRIDFGFSWN